MNGRARVLALLSLGAFWVLSIAHLDRFPAVNADEPWTLSPGYKLFTQGVYGSDMFTGFFGMDQHYLQFPPLMAVAQGAVARALGVGVFQMRFLPVVCGLLILALAHRVGARFGDAWTGTVALGLLLIWQWTPGGESPLFSGLPLLDLSRVARYDILAALLALAAFAAALEPRPVTDRRRPDWRALAVGGLAGLAALAHYYELFWVALLPALVVGAAVLERRLRAGWRSAAWMILGSLPPLGAWILFSAANRSDLIGQTWTDRERFDWLTPAFYFKNVLTEGHRYMLGASDPATYLRVGTWLLIFGVPAAWLWLAIGLWRRRDNMRLAWLLVVCPAYLLALALFVWQKRFSYLLTIIPLLAVLVALGLRSLARTRPGLTFGLLALLTAQGGVCIARLEWQAARASPPAEVYAKLRQVLPGQARIMGPIADWLAFPDGQYRALVLPAMMCLPLLTPRPMDCSQAIATVAPEFVLLDMASAQPPDTTDAPAADPVGATLSVYLRQHDARLLATVPDGQGQELLVYQLEP